MIETSHFGSLLLGLVPDLRALARCLLPAQADADALVERVLLAISSERPRPAPDKLKNRLFTLLHHEFHSIRRKLGWNGLGEPPWLDFEESGSHGGEDNDAFGSALHDLPENEREAILLVGACNFSYEATAEICGCEPAVVRKRVERACLRLKAALDFPWERVTVKGVACAGRGSLNPDFQTLLQRPD